MPQRNNETSGDGCNKDEIPDIDSCSDSSKKSKSQNRPPCIEQSIDDLIYSTNTESKPAVQCRKCSLKATSDKTGVILQCFDCFELPCEGVKSGVKAINMYRHFNAIKNSVSKLRIFRHNSQLVRKPKIRDDSFDINSFVIGERIHGFIVKDIKTVSEFNVVAISLLHDKTKAQYLHLYRNDNNNAFSINFRTTPMNSTGLPHILEHTTLCGSKMYPLRDPFFKMLNRSLATFMNAMTGSDFTMYPFSTQNYADYKNLQKVYLDAVFRPNLKELDFMQEGWRLEHVNPNDNKSDIIIKGVVYNEMKGVFSENESILQQKLQNLILPDHTYGVCSGGDPLKIPGLTWEDLKQFHRDHYHPSNSRLYSYGNFPLISSLEYINSEYLSKYEYLEPTHTEVPSQTRWVEPKKDHVACRFDNMGDPIELQNTISISYLMADINDVYETFLLQFLTELLIRGTSAPFYKTMIEPNISGGFSPSTGYDFQIRDTVFTLGLQGIKSEDFDKIEKIFDNTINEVIKHGFDEHHIESVLHRYELGLKHESSNFGLHLLFLLTPIWNHNGNIIDQMKYNSMISRLKNEMERDTGYLKSSIQKYFKDNKHRLVLTMSADKEYESSFAGTEKELITSKVAELTDEQKQTVYEKGLELQKNQDLEEDMSVLPTMVIEDISNDVPKIPQEKSRFGPIPTHIYKVNTNGLTYFRGVLNTSQLTPEQQMMLPLFCNIITKLGTDQLNYRDFDSLVDRKTSGLHFQVHIGDSLYQLHSYEPGIYISSYCLNRNVDSMWNLWSQIFNISSLKDVSRFEMLVKLYMSNLTHGISDSGHLYAMLAAQGLVSGIAYQKDLLSGLQHISYMKRLVKTSSYNPMLNELTNIAKILFDKNNFRCSINCEEDEKDTILNSVENFVSTLPVNTLCAPNGQMYTSTKIWAPTDYINCHHHVINVPINHCSKSILTVPYTNPDYAKVQILARLCSMKYLHPELREKNGAYGGGLRLSSDGVLTFFSYRDPRNTKTLDIFDKTGEWFEKNFNKISEQDILEAKLGVFQSVDAPIPPGQRGTQEFLFGLTNDVLQRHRAALMAVTHDALKEVIDKYLNANNPTTIGKVILGPKEVDVSRRKDELWTVVEND